MDPILPKKAPRIEGASSSPLAALAGAGWKQRAELAVSFLADPSITVRRASADFLTNSAGLFPSIPARVLARIPKEPDAEAVSSLLSFVGQVPDGQGLGAPVCLRMLWDQRAGIAVDAARALAEGRDLGEAAIIPMHVLAKTTARARDARVEAYLDFQGAQSERIRRIVEENLSLSERAQRELLKRLVADGPRELCDEQFAHLLVGLCSPGIAVRRFSAKVLTAYADSFARERQKLLWGGLSFISADVERETTVRQHEFLHLVRASEMPAELAPMVETLRFSDDADLQMARDFTAVYLARNGDPVAAVDRLSEMLWSPNATTVHGAASNLVILLGHVRDGVGMRILDSLLASLVARAGEGRAIVLSVTEPFVALQRFQGELVGRCAELASPGQDPDVLHALVVLIGGLTPECTEVAASARELLEYLSTVPYERVAASARHILQR